MVFQVLDKNTSEDTFFYSFERNELDTQVTQVFRDSKNLSLSSIQKHDIRVGVGPGGTVGFVVFGEGEGEGAGFVVCFGEVFVVFAGSGVPVAGFFVVCGGSTVVLSDSP